MANDQELMQILRAAISESTPQDLQRDFAAPNGIGLLLVLELEDPENRKQILFEKNIQLFGGINPYVNDFLPQILARVPTLPPAQQESTKRGARDMISRMMADPGLSAENRQRLRDALSGPLATHDTAPAAGKRRRRRKTRRAL